MKRTLCRTGLCLLAAAAGYAAHAADGTWTNRTDGQLWSAAENWLGGAAADGADASAAFDTLDIEADTTVHLDTPRTVGHLVFGDTDTNSAAGWILDDNGDGGNVLSLDGTTPSISVGTLAPGKQVEISANLSTAAGLTKTGAGTLALTGSTIVCTGDTSVDAGTLIVSSSLSSNGVIDMTSGAVLEYAVASGTLPQRKVRVTGAGTLRKTGAGTVQFGRDSGNRIDWALNEDGLIDVQQGTLYGGGYYNGYWTENQGSLNVAEGATFIGLEADIRLAKLTGTGTVHSGWRTVGSVSVGLNDASSTFDGSIINTVYSGVNCQGELVKEGTGVFKLTGNNTYTGDTTVAAGTLKVSGRLYASSPTVVQTVHVQNGATLELGTWGYGGGESLGYLSPEADQVSVSNGTLRMTGTTVSGRSATVGGAACATLAAATGADWEILGTGRPWAYGTGASLVLTGEGSGSFSKGYTGTGGIAKTGSGMWTLSGTNTVNGPVDVQAGILRVDGAALEFAAPPEGAALWLDAARGVSTNAAGSVVQWQDLSGNGRYATNADASGPSVTADINGQPAMRFTRTLSQYLECGGLHNMTGMTAFVVYRVASFPGEIMALMAEDIVSTNDLGNCVHINVETSKKFVYYINGASPNAYGNTALSTDETVISEILDDGSSWKIYKNGTEDGEAARSNPWKRLNDFRIGAWNNARYFDGSIGEIIVYDRALETEERNAVYTYLNAKWMDATIPAFTNLLATNVTVSVAAGAAVDFGGNCQTLAVLAGEGLVTNGTLSASEAIAPGGTNQIGTLTISQTVLSGPLVVDADAQTCDCLAANGSLDLSGMTLNFADSSALRSSTEYVIATYTGALTGLFGASDLPKGWELRYNRPQKVTLFCPNGTMILLQ